jgi:uncharacterized protein (TIGR03663 family)
MRKRVVTSLVLVTIAAGALALRLVQLERRPMHHDEANQAIRTRELLDRGRYRYDPEDHHGPTLYYLSLPFIWLTAGRDFASTTETTFRLLPVLFGVGLILLLLLMADGLSRPGMVGAGVLTAISPAMVFYSRFYIQETLLVFFTFGALASGWRYVRTRRLGWALATGAFAGLMHATKETCVLAYGAMAAALVVSWVTGRRRKGGVGSRLPWRWGHWLGGVAVAVGLAAWPWPSRCLWPCSRPLEPTCAARWIRLPRIASTSTVQVETPFTWIPGIRICEC